jgi:uncharacterized protein YegP (UPF0339 family)
MPQRELTKPNPRNFKNRNKLTFHIKRDGMKYFRWSLRTRNGVEICHSPDEGYDRIGKCLTSIAIVMENALEAAIENPMIK